MNGLPKIIAEMIAADGPMPLDRYMSLCLSHPQHGYYMTRDPFGRAGDFTTAPEISQVFGELIGVWCLSVWDSMGQPKSFALVELGPGRGTLMQDILRVIAKYPDCRKAAQVHFLEMSPVLRESQRERVENATWHAGLASLPALPSLVIANEFFDALPIRQFERWEGAVSERVVVLRDGTLSLGLLPSAQRLPAGEGVFEDAPLRSAFATELGHHMRTVGGAGLIFDYGHVRTGWGDTLQALKAHATVGILDYPGESDLTSHVDFEALARALTAGGARMAGLADQGDFLNAMGLQQRTEALSRTLEGDAKQNFILASERLAHPRQMGHLFKVMAFTDRRLPPPYPFEAI